jgi:hypothetical protein
VTLTWPAILWINSQVELSSLLNEETSFQNYHPPKDGITARRVATPAVASQPTEHKLKKILRLGKGQGGIK